MRLEFGKTERSNLSSNKSAKCELKVQIIANGANLIAVIIETCLHGDQTCELNILGYLTFR